MLKLRTFGGLSIERADAASAGSSSTATAARRRLALLAVLAASGPRGISRDKLLALFWPESDTDRARHALDQALYALKRDLSGEPLILGREELTVNAAAMTSDVEQFKAALARGDRQTAVELYTGPFLDGVFISGAPEFERWVDEERGRLTREVEAALEALATEAARGGDHAAAVRGWQRLATMEPRKTRIVLSLMSELAVTGDRAAALRHAELYDTLVREDSDTRPNPAVAALADRIRREPLVPAHREEQRLPDPPQPEAAIAPVSATSESVTDAAAAAPREIGARHRLTIARLRQARPRVIVALTFVVLVLIGISINRVLAGGTGAPAASWIVVADFANHTRDSIFDNALDAAFAAGIQQSPIVTLFPRASIQQTLTRMRRPASANGVRLDEALAREVAQREGIRAVIVPTIDRVDSSYVVTARLIDATTGAALASASHVARQRADVIGSLGDVVRQLRRGIGESADAIAKHDVPLPRATTGSLEALRKYADGLEAWGRSQRKSAQELFTEAVAIDSDFALAHAELGVVYYWNNDRPNGDAHFDRALSLLDRLSDRERLIVRAAAESWRGNREAAIVLRRTLLAIYPSDPGTWGRIGYDYMRLRRPREAIAAYREQLARDSSSASDYINVATAYRQLGVVDSSIRYYRRAFVIQPSFLTTDNLNHEYGSTLVMGGRFAEARAAHETMLQGDASQRALGNRSLGLLAMAQGHYTEAVERFKQAVFLTDAPRSELSQARNRLFLAAAEEQKGWRDSVSSEVRTAYSLFKRAYFEPRFLLYLGKALARDGELAPAAEVYDSLRRRMRPDNPQDRGDEQVLHGEIALARGRADSAVRLLSAAFAKDSNPFIQESLAHALARSGDLLSAARMYQSLTNSKDWYGWEPEPYGLLAALDAAELYERAGDQRSARAQYDRFAAQWAAPDSDLASLRRAQDGLARLRALETKRELRR